MLRVSGEAFDVDTFLGRFSTLRPDRVWHRGEARLGGRVSKGSGFSLVLAETEDTTSAATRVGAFLSERGELFVELAKCGASSTVDFSLEVGAPERFTESIRFPPDLLALLGRLGLELEVTGYPVSDEEE